MKILAADDELLALELLEDAIREAAPSAELYGFSKPAELLQFAENCECDVAFLDIRMRGLNGVELAKRLKERLPKINIIFVTGYEEHKADAMDLRASGYILKPVTREQVARELADLRHPVAPERNAVLRVRCFGNFDVFTPSGEPIRFERTKSKELLAYLICKRGTACTTREIAAVLFEDAPYDSRQRGYVQKIIFSMMSALKAVRAEKAINKTYNSLAVEPSLVDCDYYRFEKLDAAAVNSYTGEFMSQYSWAEFITGYLDTIYSHRP